MEIRVTKDGPYLVSDNLPLAKVTIGANEDGDPCVTHRRVTVTLQELERFVPMGLNIFEEETAEEQEW